MAHSRVFCGFPSNVITVFPASKIENEPYWCARNVPEWEIQNILEISLIVDVRVHLPRLYTLTNSMVAGNVICW